MDYLIYETEADASADEAIIFATGAAIASGLGYQLDEGIVGQTHAQSRLDATRTRRWAIPRERLDGKWAMPHPRHHPNADDVLPDGRTYQLAVMTGISADVETNDGTWWPDE